MKQFVGSVAADFAEILVIKLFDLGVFVGFALCLARVLGVKRLARSSLTLRYMRSLEQTMGCPPPVTQPPGHPMTSMK